VTPPGTLVSEGTPGDAIAAYEAEILSHMRPMTADTMVNTEMFYAPDARERVATLFRSFGEENRFLEPGEA
jgi:hypothetical protein